MSSRQIFATFFFSAKPETSSPTSVLSATKSGKRPRLDFQDVNSAHLHICPSASLGTLGRTNFNLPKCRGSELKARNFQSLARNLQAKIIFPSSEPNSKASPFVSSRYYDARSFIIDILSELSQNSRQILELVFYCLPPTDHMLSRQRTTIKNLVSHLKLSTWDANQPK